MHGVLQCAVMSKDPNSDEVLFFLCWASHL